MSFISEVRRLAIHIRDGFMCVYCGRNLANAGPRELTLDHLISQSQGGGHKSTNLASCCLRCNTRKQDKYTWRQFCLKFYPDALARIQRLRRRKVNVALASTFITGKGRRPARRAAVRATVRATHRATAPRV